MLPAIKLYTNLAAFGVWNKGRTRSKVDTVRHALSEVVRRERLAQALERQGKVELDLTHGELQKLRSGGPSSTAADRIASDETHG